MLHTAAESFSHIFVRHQTHCVPLPPRERERDPGVCRLALANLTRAPQVQETTNQHCTTVRADGGGYKPARRR